MNYQGAEELVALLADSLEKMSQVLEAELGLADEAVNLRVRASQIREDRFKVVVVGEFKRGKSTLLNALLGRDLLPQRVAPCTAVVTVLQHDEKPEARVYFVSQSGRTEERLSLEEFRKRYQLSIDDTTPDSQADFDRFSDVDHALIRYPLELCRHRVELIDSPGLGEHQVRARRTVGFLNRADAVVLVLDATMLWSLEEVHFLETVLLPLGLKNIFFVINKWNLIEESVYRPEDLEANKAELESRIRQRVAPFCVVNGVDRSPERIFRVNALGALKARLRRPPSEASLMESNVPAFEQALQRFLVEERGRARNQITVAAMQTAQHEVNRFIATQIQMAEQSIAQIEARRQSLQPQLDRLRGIQKHIEGFLDSQSANLQDRLTISFDHQIKKIDEELPKVVNQFDLSEVMKGIMVWNLLTNPLKSDEGKFAKLLKNQLEPQVAHYLEKSFARWKQSVVRNELQAVSMDVEKYLQEAAAEYHRVLREIEERLGLPGEPMEVRQMVQRWLAAGGTGRADGSVLLPDVWTGFLGFLTPLFGGLLGDICIDLASNFHHAYYLSLGGLVVLAIRLLWKEIWIRDEVRVKIVQALHHGLTELVLSQSTKMRGQVKEDFDRLKRKVTGSIVEEVALIEASLQTIIDRKKEQQFSAERERERLGKARRDIAEIIDQVEKATAGHR